MRYTIDMAYNVTLLDTDMDDIALPTDLKQKLEADFKNPARKKHSNTPEHRAIIKEVEDYLSQFGKIESHLGTA